MNAIIKWVALVLLMPVATAVADDIMLTWTNPDRTFTMTDAGAYTNPGGTKIYMEVADTADADIQSFVIPNMKPGTYKFVSVSYDDQGVASPVSNEAEKTVTSFVTIDPAVYIVAKIPGNFLLLVVGTVPLGTPCNPSVEVNGHYSVPSDQVTWTGAHDVIAVAKCG